MGLRGLTCCLRRYHHKAHRAKSSATNIPITRKILRLRLRLRKGVLGAPPKFPSCADLPEQLRVYRTVTRALIGRPISFDVSFHRRGGFGQKIRRIKIVFTRNANQSE